jgi:hypothetical protein
MLEYYNGKTYLLELGKPPWLPKIS